MFKTINTLIAIIGLALVIISAYMAFHSVEDWGWFLFVALVLLGASLDAAVKVTREADDKSAKSTNTRE